MISRWGNMWNEYDYADLFLITTNSTIKRDGRLVMGRGMAKQARDKFPGLDMELGLAIREAYGNLGRYHLLISPKWPAKKIGALQVKTHYSLPADITLIEESISVLNRWAREHPGTSIHLNFPGIGNGRLSVERVLPVVHSLPNSVSVWRYSSG